jgi:hypothetical protein
LSGNLLRRFPAGAGVEKLLRQLLRQRGTVFHAAVTPQTVIPAGWGDLNRDIWDYKIAMADATQSSLALALVVGMLQLTSNNRSTSGAAIHTILTYGNEDAIAKVESEEAWAGIVPHDSVYAYRQVAKSPPDR